jgi:hypothetical protein
VPYIKASDRDDLLVPQTAGELNWKITNECLNYLHQDGGSPTYADYNEVIGALECCKLELYRRAVVPYEERKIEENGDVYT